MVKHRKFVGIVAAIVLVLAMGSLSACGGSGGSIVGFWKLKSTTGEDALDEATVAGLEEDGLTITFEATKDGAAVIDFMGEQRGGTWSGKSGDFTVTFDDGDIEAKVQGNLLTLVDLDGEMIFERAQQQSKEDAEKSDSEAIVGTWKLVDVTGDDEFDAEMLELLDEMGMAITFVATEDGQAVLDLAGDSESGTWSESGGKVTITMDGESIEAQLEGDTLKFESDGAVLAFERMDGEAAAEMAGAGDTAVVAPTSDEYPSFGDTVTMPSGIEVTVDGPFPYELSDDWLEESYPPEDGPLVAFDVLVVNGTSEEIDAWQIVMKVVSDGEQAEEVWDSSGGVTVPNSTILPGKSLKYRAAFQVADPGDIQFSWEMALLDDGTVHFLTD